MKLPSLPILRERVACEYQEAAEEIAIAISQMRKLLPGRVGSIEWRHVPVGGL
ncbi:MAG: hypothetical protein KAW17_03495 [Candidatus Eisenbacteria sp.]|nr:hypothetical protein [Candidatus Eisenbacteria bacterium]